MIDSIIIFLIFYKFFTTNNLNTSSYFNIL